MKISRILSCLVLAVLGILTIAPLSFAADPTPTPTTTDNLTISVTYPRIEGAVGTNFSWEVKLAYAGDSPKVFDLSVKGPTGWTTHVNPQYETGTKISSIRIDPVGPGTTVNAVAAVQQFPLPDPGTYKFTFTASSGTVKASTDLTAILTPRYSLTLVSANEQSSPSLNAQAGKDNFYAVKVQNLGTTALDKIGFTATNPSGWTISFNPQTVDSLSYFDEKSVDVNIKPPADAAAGDYVVSLTASNDKALSQKLDVRVTVQGDNVWGWMSVGAIFVFLIAVSIFFLKFIKR